MSLENTPIRGTATYTSSGDQTAIIDGIEGQYFYVTDVVVANLAAPNFCLIKSGASDTLFGIGPEILIVGALGQFSKASFITPLRCGEGEDVIVETANANSITVTVSGFYATS